MPSEIHFTCVSPSSNLTASSSVAWWRETSRGCEGRPGTPTPGFAPRWPTWKTDRLTPKRGARAPPTTPQRRGSLWRKARGAYGRMKRTTAAKQEPDRQLRRPRARRARSSSQLWLFHARYYACLSSLTFNALTLSTTAYKLKTREDTKTAPFCSHDSSLKAPTLHLFCLYNTSKAWQDPAAVWLEPNNR